MVGHVGTASDQSESGQNVVDEVVDDDVYASIRASRRCLIASSTIYRISVKKSVDQRGQGELRCDAMRYDTKGRGRGDSRGRKKRRWSAYAVWMRESRGTRKSHTQQTSRSSTVVVAVVTILACDCCCLLTVENHSSGILEWDNVGAFTQYTINMYIRMYLRKRNGWRTDFNPRLHHSKMVGLC